MIRLNGQEARLAEGSERNNPPGAAGPHKRVGSTVRGKYTVDAFLATGTMANVYAATHRNGSRVALKILHKLPSEDASLCERFKREGYFANSIGHPGIVRAIDDDITEDGCPFLVMELLDGETLEERRRRKGGRLPCAWVLPVADTLLEILAAAHAREVVHRDLKPANVFVTRGGEVKVLDFGVARWNDGQTSSDMTAVGMVLGTPAYMPPEQALGRREDVDAQSDIWAVGATLFVVLSGESVHIGGDAKAKLIATARTAARPLLEAASGVPRAVAAVIDRALAFHKSERWPSADAMREALRWARLAIDEPTSQASAWSVPSPEPMAAPVDTPRNADDEPTLARMLPPRDDSMPGSPASHDFLTSAPPITLREQPKSTAASSSDPVFSLRREKEVEVQRDSLSPSTERLLPPPAEGGHAKVGSTAVDTRPGFGELSANPDPVASYDPSAAETMGLDTPGRSHESAPSSVDVRLSFTRPMAAMVMPPDWPPAPRPAAGAPASTDERSNEPAAYAATLADPRPETFPPPAFTGEAAYPSNAPRPGSSAPATDFVCSRQQPTPPQRRLLAAATSADLRPQGGEPGPMLSQIVKPSGGRFLKIGVPLMIALAALTAGFFALRARAANARARATTVAAAPPSAVTPSTEPAHSGALPTGAASGTTATPSPEPAAAIAASTAPDPPKKKKKRPRPAAVKPSVEPVEPAADPPEAPVVTPPSPADTTPKDALPKKDAVDHGVN